MTVGELLERIDSREIAEWQAFERAFGPIGFEWRDEALAEIHEQLQYLAALTGAQFEENPAPKPRRYPRPTQLYEPEEPEDQGDLSIYEEI